MTQYSIFNLTYHNSIQAYQKAVVAAQTREEVPSLLEIELLSRLLPNPEQYSIDLAKPKVDLESIKDTGFKSDKKGIIYASGI